MRKFKLFVMLMLMLSFGAMAHAANVQTDTVYTGSVAISQAVGTSTSDASGRGDKWHDGSISPDTAGNDSYIESAEVIHLQKAWGGPVSVTGFVVTCTSDQGCIDSANPTVEATLQGSNDPGSGWTDLGTTSDTDTGGLVLSKFSGLDSTPYLYHRLVVGTPGTQQNDIYVLEAEFYSGIRVLINS